MGAVFGFTGPRDDRRLTIMSRLLRHRGRATPPTSRSRPAVTVAGLEAEEVLPISPGGTNVLDLPDLLLAGCGYITGHELPVVAPVPPRSAWQTWLARLAEQYRRDGLNCFATIHGAFLLVIVDGDSVHVARDGAGVRTAYYGRVDGEWVFGPEPKVITNLPEFHARIRPAALAQYLSFSFVPGEGTMLDDVYEIPAGHVVTLKSSSSPRLRRFFCFEDAEPDETTAGPATEHASEGPRSQVDWAQRFKQEMARAVQARLPASGPVGIFLSGGLDSSVITAEVMRQYRNGPVSSYAIHFGDKYPHELDFARSVAQRCGTQHHEILIRPQDFLPRLRQMVWHLDEPIGDPITQPNFELASRVRGEVRWVFNGEGGDPCFGGPKNIPMLLHHWYGGIPREAGFRERCYLASYRRAYDELRHLLHPDWQRRIDPEHDLESVVSPYFSASRPRPFLNKLMAINIRLKGAHLILPKVERMTAAWGIVPLSPLFDERLVRLSFEMPPRWKLRHGIEKYVIKAAYADDLPREVIDRPKSGMRVPVHFWFQKEMRRYARHLLSPRAIRRAGIFDPRRVTQLLRYETEEGPGRYGLRLWMLLTFEIWRRIVVEKESV